MPRAFSVSLKGAVRVVCIIVALVGCKPTEVGRWQVNQVGGYLRAVDTMTGRSCELFLKDERSSPALSWTCIDGPLPVDEKVG